MVKRENNALATAATLNQLAVSSILSKKAGKLFKEQIEELTDED